MKLNCNKALVTGGAGFIGSHIIDRLLERDFDVKAVDNLSSGRLENIDMHLKNAKFHFTKGDIRDEETVRRVFRDVDIVFHEAAFVGISESIHKPLLANDINVNGMLNVLEASLRSGVKRVIVASSAAVYGEPKTLPIREDSTPCPESPYAASKLATELYAKAYHRTYGLETVCFRYFNVYGPRQALGPYAAVITAFVDDLIKDRRPTIYGDGEQTRDFINVQDAVQANILAMEKNCAGEVFNIATGSSVTINHLLEAVKRALGKSKIKPKYCEQRPNDIRQSCGDIRKANKILGFKSEISLERGLKDFVQYHRTLVTK